MVYPKAFFDWCGCYDGALLLFCLLNVISYALLCKLNERSCMYLNDLYVYLGCEFILYYVMQAPKDLYYYYEFCIPNLKQICTDFCSQIFLYTDSHVGL